jgi:hypothetical protein
MRQSILRTLVAVSILLLAGFQSLSAQGTGSPTPKKTEKSKIEVLESAAVRIEKLMNETDMKALYRVLDQMKPLGLSWNESVTLPTSGIIAGKSEEQLFVIWGMQTMDATYALLFGKSIEKLLRSNAEIDAKIQIPRELIKLDALKINRDEKVDKSVANTYAMLRAAKSNPVVLNALVGGFYGSTLELIYIISKLGLQSGIDGDFVRFMNANVLQLQLAAEILDAYSGNGELAQLLDLSDRKAVIASILDVLKTAKYNLAEKDIRKILALVDAVRAPLAAVSD